MDRLSGLSRAQIGGVPIARFVATILGIAIRLVVVAYVGRSGAKFFYQGF